MFDDCSSGVWRDVGKVGKVMQKLVVSEEANRTGGSTWLYTIS
jgi:hypothetical protein